MKNSRKSLLHSFTALLMICGLSFPAASQGKDSSVAAAAFVQGTTAFRSGEWISAVFTLRRAVSYPENYNSDTWYMLITAEMYAGEYKTAYQDCETFLKSFPDSPYVSYITYHKGRVLFSLGEYERSILLLSDFCHYYPDNEMYASALFWIAEAFFASYNYDDAKTLYTRIVKEFADDAKASAAQYRLETISQNAREEKLLYLLRETGEEYLAAKEEYERQMLLSGSESALDIRRRLLELQHKNSELEKQITDLNHEKMTLESRLGEEIRKNADIKNANDSMIRELKEKAQKTQELLIEKSGEGY